MHAAHNDDDGVVGGKAWATNTSTALLVGVFNGAFYIDSTWKTNFCKLSSEWYNIGKDYNTGQ